MPVWSNLNKYEYSNALIRVNLSIWNGKHSCLGDLDKFWQRAWFMHPHLQNFIWIPNILMRITQVWSQGNASMEPKGKLCVSQTCWIFINEHYFYHPEMLYFSRTLNIRRQKFKCEAREKQIAAKTIGYKGPRYFCFVDLKSASNRA